MAVDVRVEGINAVLRALNSFGKEANAELRDEAQRVADRDARAGRRRRRSAQRRHHRRGAGDGQGLD